MYSLRFVPLIFVAFIVYAIGYYVVTAPDHSAAGQKIGDAINGLNNWSDKSVLRQLASRTPGDKLGNAAWAEKKAFNQQ